GDLMEGGIRVPFLMQWKGALPEGLVYREPVATIDIVPTVMAAAGLPVDQRLDGVDLLPYLTGQSAGPPHQSLCWRSQNAAGWAVRQGDWKLLYHAKTKHPRMEMFHLKEDPAEENDLA